MKIVFGRGRLPALLAALGLAVAVALLASSRPLSSLAAFAWGPFASPWSLAALASAAAPLLVAGIGAGIAFRGGVFNLGGEGQSALGFLVGALFLSRAGSLDPLIALPLAFLLAAASGGLLALLSGLAERLFGASVLLTSFLLSQATVLAVDWALGGPLKDPASNLLGMAPLPGSLLLPRLPGPLPLGLGPGLALLLALGAVLLVRGSRQGYELGLFGASRRFARAQGFGPHLDLWPLSLSGALMATAGLLLLLGGSGRPVQGLSAGLGWNGLAIALVAGNDPAAAIPAALLFAWLGEGGKSASILSDLPPETSALIVAAIFLLVTARIEPGSGQGKAEARGSR